MLPDVVAEQHPPTRPSTASPGSAAPAGSTCPPPSTTTITQPDPNCPEACLAELRLQLRERPEIPVSQRPPACRPGSPPAPPITSQNMLWFACPPPLLRTAPRIASGNSPTRDSICGQRASQPLAGSPSPPHSGSRHRRHGVYRGVAPSSEHPPLPRSPRTHRAATAARMDRTARPLPDSAPAAVLGRTHAARSRPPPHQPAAKPGEQG